MAYADGAEPIAVLSARFAVAAVCLLVICALRREPLPEPRLALAILGLGGIGYVCQSLAFFSALELAPVGIVSLLLYLSPALVTLGSVVLFGARLSAVSVGVVGLALVGTALTVGPSLGNGGGSAQPLGIVLGVASAFLYTGYILTGSRLTPRAGALASATLVCCGAAVSFGVLTFFAGMARIGPSDASALSTVEPALTVVLAALVLGERIGPIQLLGGALILAAVVALSRGSGTTPEQAHP